MAGNEEIQEGQILIHETENNEQPVNNKEGIITPLLSRNWQIND